MLRLLWTVSIQVRLFLRRYAPTNLLLDAIHARRGLKWGLPTMLLAVPYLWIASILATVIREGGPGWFNLLVLLFAWDALKMLWIGPNSVVLLVRVKRREGLQGYRSEFKSQRGDSRGPK